MYACVCMSVSVWCACVLVYLVDTFRFIASGKCSAGVFVLRRQSREPMCTSVWHVPAHTHAHTLTCSYKDADTAPVRDTRYNELQLEVLHGFAKLLPT